MIVPQFWAEGRVRHNDPGRQVTVRRFGWSDLSAADAQAMADARAQQAMARILSGDKLERREPKVPYNGAAGVPIREEILSTHGDTVITRNAYGAHCLNTPEVLFADVDSHEDTPLWLHVLTFTALFLATSAYAIWIADLRWFLAGILVSLVAGILLSGLLFSTFERLAGGPSQRALRRIRTFAARHPDWQLRLYQTPAGYRVLAMHSTFDPNSTIAADCFRQLGTDPIYVRMCQRQNCFRARVSPKPWRMGIAQKIKPRPGVWPVNPERLPERQQWIDTYEAKTAEFASCRFIQTFGMGGTHPAAEKVRLLHDERCRAHSGLPLA